jgi:hypothetical protein
LTGCRCEYKDKELEGDLKGETYDENKDLLTCGQCSDWDKYNTFIKIKLSRFDKL